jgi:hypothetical protein
MEVEEMAKGLTGQDLDRRLMPRCVVDGEAAKAEKLSAEKLATEKQASRELAQAATPGKRERRAQSRHEVDTSAVILLINASARTNGFRWVFTREWKRSFAWKG